MFAIALAEVYLRGSTWSLSETLLRCKHFQTLPPHSDISPMEMKRPRNSGNQPAANLNLVATRQTRSQTHAEAAWRSHFEGQRIRLDQVRVCGTTTAHRVETIASSATHCSTTDSGCSCWMAAHLKSRQMTEGPGMMMVGQRYT